MKRQYFALLLIGVNSVCCQIILIREILAIFSGNELTMGFVLASWFIWVALGSALGGRWKIKGEESVPLRFVFLQILLPFVLIFQIILIRESRYIFRLPQMAVVGLGPLFLVSFTLLAPLCLILGMMFSLGYQWFSPTTAAPAQRVGWVYVLEAAGAGIGGGLFSFLLIRIITHIQIGLLLGILNHLSAALIFSYVPSQHRKTGIWVSWAFTSLFIIFFLLSSFFPLDLFLYSFQWRGSELLACQDSMYGRIALTRLSEEYNFYEHGVLTSTIPDLWSAEWIAHLPLLQHPQPKKVLLIGTGIGSIGEALKYPGIGQIDYVELDPTALSLAARYLPKKYSAPLKNQKVHSIHKDARLFIKEADTQYDVVILGLPDPKTAQLNRMYTLEFFSLVSHHLTSNGIFAFSATSSENYIGPQLADFLKCLYITIKKVFPNVLVTPGDTACFLAGKSNAFLTLDPDEIVKRLNERHIDTSFFSESYLPSILSKERVEKLTKVLEENQNVVINKDLTPMCYLYDLILWGRYFSPTTGAILEKAKGMEKRTPLIILFFALLPLIFIRFFDKKKSRQITVGGVVLIQGFIEIGLEVLLVLSFQIFYGYAYFLLGILITGFMVGLTLGSACMTHLLERLKCHYQWFIGIHLGFFLYPLALLTMFKSMDMSRLPPHIMEVLFFILMIIAGLIGGFHFPIATKLFISPGQQWKAQAGLLYGLDLIGSAFSAILASSYFIPLFGINSTFALLSLLSGIGLFLLLLNL